MEIENLRCGKNVLKMCKYADIVFIALHGGIGENGQLQAMFELMGIKYTGSGYKASMIAMDKILTKKVLKEANIMVPKAFYINSRIDNFSGPWKNLRQKHMVKPSGEGSSVGMRIVRTHDELVEAVYEAEKFDENILIEEYIHGREFSVGILGGKALSPIEIKPKDEFFDYKNKYQKGMAEEICPVDLPSEKIKELKKIALKVHKELGLKDYSRIDFLFDGRYFYCLEANTLPGMTPNSLLPKEAAVDKINYEELCERIVQMGLEKEE